MLPSGHDPGGLGLGFKVSGETLIGLARLSHSPVLKNWRLQSPGLDNFLARRGSLACAHRQHRAAMAPVSDAARYVHFHFAFRHSATLRKRKPKLWQSIRERVLERDRGECQCCGRKAEQVHHRDYRPRVLSGEDIDPLVSVCRWFTRESTNEIGRRGSASLPRWRKRKRQKLQASQIPDRLLSGSHMKNDPPLTVFNGSDTLSPASR